MSQSHPERHSDILRSLWKRSLAPRVSAVMDCGLPGEHPTPPGHPEPPLQDEALGTRGADAVSRCHKAQHGWYVE